MNQHHPPPPLHLHLALADVVDDRLEVLPSKGPNQGLHHHLLKKVKLGILLDHLGDLSSTFLCHQMDAKLSSLWVGRQPPHLPASTWMALLPPCPGPPPPPPPAVQTFPNLKLRLWKSGRLNTFAHNFRDRIYTLSVMVGVERYRWEHCSSRPVGVPPWHSSS